MNPNSPDRDFNVKWYIKQHQQLPNLKNHSAVIYKEQIIIFGGYNGKDNLNKTFIYDIDKDKWKLQKTNGDIPYGRNGHTSTVVNDKMYVIGGWLGEGDVASDEVYTLDLVDYTWLKVSLTPGIGPSNKHSADLYKDTIYIFRGGNGKGYLNDLIAFNVSTLRVEILETTGKNPSIRANHSSSIVGENLYIFGGWNGQKRLTDLYTINLEKLVWSHIDTFGNKPSSRAGVPMVNYKNYLIIFGGSGKNQAYFNDLFFYDTSII